MFRFMLLALLFGLHAVAQTDNLTITFIPGDTERCGENAREALTFTTLSIPSEMQCFNMATLFNSTNTSSVSGSYSFTPFPGAYSDEEVSWALTNANVYSSSSNYSRFSYLQQNATDPGKGKDAARVFQVYSGRDCHQIGPDDESLYPNVGFSCQSSSVADCYTVPFNIQSFRLESAARVNEIWDKCWIQFTGTASPGTRVSKVAAFLLIVTAALISYSI